MILTLLNTKEVADEKISSGFDHRYVALPEL